MKALVNFSKQINLEVEGEKPKDVLFTAINMVSYPKKCEECGNDKEFEPRADKDQDGNKYIKIVCMKCGAQSNMGTYKDGSGHFWKKFENWKTASQSGGSESVDPNSVPF